MNPILTPFYYLVQFLQSILQLLALILKYPLQLIWTILNPILSLLAKIIVFPLYHLYLLIKTPLSLFFSTFKFFTVLTAILTIPLANYMVFKSNTATQKQKLGYVSTITILLGFMMVLLEIKSENKSNGLSQSIDSRYQKKTSIEYLNIDHFDVISNFEKYQDWPFCVASNDQLVNLQRMLQITDNRIVYQMPDSLFRDQGIYKTLKANNQLDNTLLIEIGTFPSNEHKESLFSSYQNHSDNVVNLEDVPFIGAELNFDRLLVHSSKKAVWDSAKVVWIRLGKLNQLDVKHVSRLVEKIQEASDVNGDAGDRYKMQQLVVLISLSSNSVY
jgi:hypothetical protein